MKRTLCDLCSADQFFKVTAGLVGSSENVVLVIVGYGLFMVWIIIIIIIIIIMPVTSSSRLR